MSSMDRLKNVLLTPTRPTEAVGQMSWDEIEALVGYALPPDYKDFINEYGTGCVDEFLWVLNPFSQNRNLNLLDQLKLRREANKEFLDEVSEQDLGLSHPSLLDLIPCAISDNGDVIYWHPNGSPELWKIVVVAARAWRRAIIDSTLTEFLAQVVTRNIAIDIFPDDFPSLSPSFASVQ